jgi:hypothetical protein
MFGVPEEDVDNSAIKQRRRKFAPVFKHDAVEAYKGCGDKAAHIPGLCARWR